MSRSFRILLPEDTNDSSNMTAEQITRSLRAIGLNPVCVAEDDEAPYRMIVDDLSEIIVRFGADGIITFVNPAYEKYIGSRLAGLLPGSLVGQSIYDLMQVKNYDDINRFLASIAANRETRSLERSFIDTDGQTCWVNWKMRPLYDENDRFYAFQAIGDIVTERKENELKLEEQKSLLAAWIRFYELVLAASGQVAYDYHVPTGGIRWSPTSADVLGYTPEEMSAGYEQWIELIHPDDRERVLEGRSAGIASASFCELKYRIMRKDGTFIAIRDSGYFALDEIRGGIQQIGVLQDITRLQHAEKEREHFRHLLANIIDSMPSIVVAIDTDQVVTQWNAGAARQVGLSSEQAIGRQIGEVMPMFSSMVANLQWDLRNLSTEHRHRAGVMINGEPRYFNIVLYPLFTDHLDGAVIRIDEITESVLMQELLVQNEKMMMLGGMAAGMAHEINNPLSGILQAVQNIENRLSPDLAKNRQVAGQCGLSMDDIGLYAEKRQILEFLAGIRDSGSRAASIISSMLQFSRRSESKKGAVDLAALLDHSIELAGNYYNVGTGLDFRKIDIIREYDPGLGAVHCAANEIEQVILNLLKNATQALNEGRANVGNPRIILRTRRDGDSVIIEIEDNGPGMNQDIQKRIFEPFFTTKPTEAGTGLGMSVSRFIITHNHQGQMEVDSKEGQGTRITISLPVNRLF